MKSSASSAEEDRIAAVVTKIWRRIEGDLFIDCSGHRALLIGEQLGQRAGSTRRHMLFNDRALAVAGAGRGRLADRVADHRHRAFAPAGSGTSACRPGAASVASIPRVSWPTKRPKMCFAAMSARGSATRRRPTLSPRRLVFPTGYRERFWARQLRRHRPVGGLRRAARSLGDRADRTVAARARRQFPGERGIDADPCRRFNELFRTRWERIVEFLKLHYVLSGRDEPYWRGSSPSREPIAIGWRICSRLWRDQPPSSYDFPHDRGMFPAASYQYVLYGMTGQPAAAAGRSASIMLPFERRSQSAPARFWPRFRPTATISMRCCVPVSQADRNAH